MFFAPKMPADLKEESEKTVTSKPEVIAWLKRSFEAVKEARLAETPKDLQRTVPIADRDAKVDGMYLRILVHANEHMGQLVAYARMTGVVPPWSVAISAARRREYPGGDFFIPCVLVIKRLSEGDRHDKAQLNAVLREHGASA